MNAIEAQELDYGIAMSVRALVIAMGMQAENKQREILGQSMAYPIENFMAVLDENGIDNNSILSRWYEVIKESSTIVRREPRDE